MKTDENTNVEQLAKLGEEFRKTYEAAEKSKLLVEAHLKKSTADAIACGMILTKAKKLAGHGGWLKWLKEHAKVSNKTAERYMHLARNSSSVTNLTAKSVTQCYRDLGLLKEPTSKSLNTQSAKPQPSEYVQAKGLAVRLWNLLVKTTDADRMVQEIKAIILWHQEYLEQKQKRESALHDGFDENVELKKAA